MENYTNWDRALSNAEMETMEGKPFQNVKDYAEAVMDRPLTKNEIIELQTECQKVINQRK